MGDVDFRVAAKGFIVNDKGELLVLKRLSKAHMPGIWEPPGGRVEPGEDPVDGLTREISEETGLKVDVGEPMTVRHFKRQDGQFVTMICFLCKLRAGEVRLSDEHSDFKWINLGGSKEELDEYLNDDKFYQKELDVYRDRFGIRG